MTAAPPLARRRLAGARYAAPQLHAVELERVFRGSWLFLGREGAPGRTGAALERALAEIVGERLNDARVERWAGFLWAHAGDQPADLATDLAGIDRELAPYRLEEMRPIEERCWIRPCNWKAVLDNACETYHVPWVHGPSLERFLRTEPEYVALGEHSRQVIEIAVGPWRRWLDAATSRGGPYDERRRSAMHKYWLFPNTVLNVLPYHLTVMSTLPLGPDRCRFFYGFYGRRSAPPLEWLRARATWLASRWVMREDTALLERVGAGAYGARRFEFPVHRQEWAIAHHHAVLDRRDAASHTPDVLLRSPEGDASGPSMRTSTHAIDLGDGAAVHLVSVLPADDAALDPEAARAALARVLDEASIEPLHERVYGVPGAGSAPVWPVCRIGAPLPEGGTFGGLQLVGVSGEVRVRPVADAAGPLGRIAESGRLRMLFLTDVRGLEPGAARPSGAVDAQLARIFERAFAAAEREGFAPRDLARTWIYLDPILRHYDALNRVRNELFEDLGLRGGPGGTPPPASTGIQGAHPQGDAGFLDLVFVAPVGDAPHPLAPLGAAEQCEAWDYGSAFSRASTLHLGADRLVYVSGTASIDRDGRTHRPGEPAAQLAKTFEVVSGILERAGARFDDVVSGALFLKDREVHRAWRAALERGELPGLPVAVIEADICRDDLLVELEVTALVRGTR